MNPIWSVIVNVSYAKVVLLLGQIILLVVIFCYLNSTQIHNQPLILLTICMHFSMCYIFHFCKLFSCSSICAMPFLIFKCRMCLQLSRSSRELSKFATIALVEVDAEEIQVYVRYFDITMIPSTVFFFNAQHMKMDSG